MLTEARFKCEEKWIKGWVRSLSHNNHSRLENRVDLGKTAEHWTHVVIYFCYLLGFTPFQPRAMKDMELDASSMEKRFAYKFLKKILKYVDSAQEFIAHLGKYHCEILQKCMLLR